MKILAIELSSLQGSLAVMEDERVLAQESWMETRRGGRPFFEVLERLPSQCGIRLADFGLIAVGRGPGSYSGLRVALTAAQSLSLVDGIPLHVVSSGEAMARQLGEASGVDRVAVVGDARREQLWLGQISRMDGGEWSLFHEWSLVRLDDLESMLDDGTLTCSPDWSARGTLFKAAAPAVRWVEKDCWPQAVAVGLFALVRERAGIPSEAATPLYLHPPVFVPPAPVL